MESKARKKFTLLGTDDVPAASRLVGPMWLWDLSSLQNSQADSNFDKFFLLFLDEKETLSWWYHRSNLWERNETGLLHIHVYT